MRWLSTIQPRSNRNPARCSQGLPRHPIKLLKDADGAALLEFAIVLPLLVVFVVGIFDFSGAFNQKQKIAQAAQEGAILAAAQPMSDIETTNASPDSLQPVVSAIFNSLAGSGVLANANTGACKPPTSSTGWVPTSQTGVAWTYSISGCSNNPASTTAGCFGDTTNKLFIQINRGWLTTTPSPPVTVVGTSVTVSYDYDWRFNSVIQLLFPGAGYSAKTCLAETSSVHNQL
jgi:Flp pilus assembly protein TadG